jgi:Fe-S-cluster containining protein
VKELGKGMYRTCVHVGGQGCSIYQERPRSCRVWSCQWQLGEIDGDSRADASRLV